MEQKYKELGFGTKAFNQAARQLNKDGTFNVSKKGLPWFRPYEIYHILLEMSWWKFSCLVLASYLLINFFFAGLYLLVGLQHLEGINGTTGFERFWDTFFFSSQTITTLGYGRISPIGAPASILAAFESLLGLLAFALATGLLYGRFSRPKARILFSDKAVICPYQDRTALMFRLANLRSSLLIEAEIQVILSFFDAFINKRRFVTLDLELEKINFMSLSWTVVHPTDDNSILKNGTPESIKAMDLELVIMLKAFDDTFSQNVYTRTSYKYDEISWGKKFKSVISQDKDKKYQVDLELISELED